MNLFANAGVELPAAGGGRRVTSPRSLRVPLFNYGVVEDARKRLVFRPTDAQRQAASDYTKLIKTKGFLSQKETSARPHFIDKVLVEILGYRRLNAEGGHTIKDEHGIRAGSVDAALGEFSHDPTLDVLHAPFELKGPTTGDLDAIMPGRGKSPVQQAWEYAMDAPGARWVLVSNCLEIRLYRFGRGRDAYEVFDLTRLDEEDEHARLWLMLSSLRFLGGDTEQLLRQTDSAYKTVTNDLYSTYKSLRDKLMAFLTDSADGPKMSALQAIESAQKILDRILFIAFAERTDLLPERLLERATKARNEFVPTPMWDNFRSLFRFVDQGHRADGFVIPAYNGGLFAVDPALDGVVIPDPLATELAGLGQWDYRREVPVTVLGHLFEQSITDIEALKAYATGQEAPTTSSRKRHGVVYTPDMITRFMVERTLGLTLKERFDALWSKHGLAAKLALGESPSEEEEHPFWSDYLLVLRDLTIVDPACGSGAFLVAAYDTLSFEYRRVISRLEALGVLVDFDWVDEIVTKNIYGVDLNAESVEISRLSLWLKTARREHRLQNLEATIKTGNSLIDDAAFTDRPFDWQAAFPEVFARGGFDIVLGNPPYVRMELIKPIKPYLEQHYVVADDRTDLYAYFFEKGVRVLKDGGRLGFISSSTFFRTGSGEKLRTFLGDGVAMESIVDFGDLQVFEGVTTYPAILTLRRGGEGDAGDLSYLALKDMLPVDLGQSFIDGARTMPRARLGAGSWRLEGDALSALRDKITAGKKSLGEVYGAPLYGIKTGLNAAFVIDKDTRDRLVKEDPKSADLLKPFLRGENIKRWRVESENLWLINTPKGLVDIEAYPAIKKWLLPFQSDLEKRATKQEWWELQQAQLAYQPSFSNSKIIYGHFAAHRIFAFDESGQFSNDKSYVIPTQKQELLALLNSTVLWFALCGLAPAVRGGFNELRVQYIEQLPIPNMTNAEQAAISKLAGTCTLAARERFKLQDKTRRRILDLATGSKRKLSGKLEAFWTLDFAGFMAEVKKSFGTDIRVKERGEWQDLISEATTKINALSTQIADAEREIDTIVYGLFDLTPAEIDLLESALK